eukprot:g4844.t1
MKTSAIRRARTLQRQLTKSAVENDGMGILSGDDVFAQSCRARQASALEVCDALLRRQETKRLSVGWRKWREIAVICRMQGRHEKELESATAAAVEQIQGEMRSIQSTLVQSVRDRKRKIATNLRKASIEQSARLRKRSMDVARLGRCVRAWHALAVASKLRREHDIDIRRAERLVENSRREVETLRSALVQQNAKSSSTARLVSRQTRAALVTYRLGERFCRRNKLSTVEACWGKWLSFVTRHAIIEKMKCEEACRSGIVAEVHRSETNARRAQRLCALKCLESRLQSRKAIDLARAFCSWRICSTVQPYIRCAFSASSNDDTDDEKSIHETSMLLPTALTPVTKVFGDSMMSTPLCIGKSERSPATLRQVRSAIRSVVPFDATRDDATALPVHVFVHQASPKILATVEDFARDSAVREQRRALHATVYRRK